MYKITLERKGQKLYVHIDANNWNKDQLRRFKIEMNELKDKYYDKEVYAAFDLSNKTVFRLADRYGFEHMYNAWENEEYITSYWKYRKEEE